MNRLLLSVAILCTGCSNKATGPDIPYSGGGELFTATFPYDAMGKGTFWFNSTVSFLVDSRQRKYTATIEGVFRDSPRVSPDSKSIVGSGSDVTQRPTIFLSTFTPDAPVALTNDGYWKDYPSWSYDGSSVFFIRQDDTPQKLNIVRVSLVIPGAVTIINPSASPTCASGMSTSTVSESAEGQLAFLQWRASGNLCLGPDLYSMRSDGSDKRHLASPENGTLFSPAWSPDGTKIAVGVSVPDAQGANTYSTSIRVVNADGSGMTTVATVLSQGSSGRSVSHDPVCWSADGTRILFLVPDQPGAFAYSVRPDGTGLTKVIWAVGLSCGK